MRVFVVTVARRRLLGRPALSPAVAQRIEAALSDPVWVVRDRDRRESWTSPSGLVRIDAVSNEPPSTGPLIQAYPSGNAAVWTGHIDDESFRADRPDPGTVARLPGNFALAAAFDDGADGFTCVHRIEPLYVATGKDVYVLSSSARTAYRVAGGTTTTTTVAFDALLGLSGAGFMINDATPFPGVTAVPADSHISVRPSGVRVSRLPGVDIDPAAPVEELSDRLLDALLTAARAAGRRAGTPTVQLTGGKDSRLVAAALAGAGIDFKTYTYGNEMHPDVVVARQVAAALGVPFSLVTSSGRRDDVLTVRPLTRAYRTVRACDGMVSAYDSAGVRGRYREGNFEIGGQGGELLRGGYALGIDASSPQEITARVFTRLAPNYQLLSQAARRRMDQILAPWIRACATDVARASEEMYRTLRTGRWHAALRASRTIEGPRREFLSDNQLVRIASAADQEAAAQHRLVHAAVHRLRPDLCRIPFAGSRWAFERKGPTPYCEPDEWEARAPIPTKSAASWDWRDDYPEPLHAYFVEAILSAPLFDDLFDRRATEQFLAGGAHPPRTFQMVKLTWSMYTASQLLAGVGSHLSEPDGPVFELEVPKAALGA